jgi:hypothetical protein
MNKKEIIDQEVQKTLQFLEPMEKVSADPYFYTRLQARLRLQHQQKENRFELFGSRWWRPALAGMIVILNLTTAALVYMSNEKSKELNQDTLTTLATEYGLNQDDSDLFSANK